MSGSADRPRTQPDRGRRTNGRSSPPRQKTVRWTGERRTGCPCPPCRFAETDPSSAEKTQQKSERSGHKSEQERIPFRFFVKSKFIDHETDLADGVRTLSDAIARRAGQTRVPETPPPTTGPSRSGSGTIRASRARASTNRWPASYAGAATEVSRSCLSGPGSPPNT